MTERIDPQLMAERDAKYRDYLERHRAYVYEECQTLHIADRGRTHDLSKYSEYEWAPYAQYFYGGYARDQVPEYVQRAFDRAWLAHQHANDHHWQHWVLREDSGAVQVLEMNELALLELLADWRGAGRAILGAAADTTAWYLKNAEKMLLHPSTRAFIEGHLQVPQAQRWTPVQQRRALERVR